MKRATAKKLHLSKETLRTLSAVDLRAVIGGTDVLLSEPGANCADLEGTTSCAESADGCAIDLNPNLLIGVKTVRRF